MFVEILQNCPIFNDGTFDNVTDRGTRDDSKVDLEHGMPLVFGKDHDRGIRLQGLTAEVVQLGENGVREEDLLHHDEKTPDPSLAYLLSKLGPPDFPMPMGVFRALEVETYDEGVHRQIREAREMADVKDLDALLREGDVWEISEGTKP